MSTPRLRLLLAAGSLIGILTVTACAAGAGSAAPTSTPAPALSAVDPGLPDGRVIGVGTVIDTAGEAALCLGAVLESFPPQCDGIPLDGWTWEGVDGSESSGETVWGSYAVYGTYDGERYTVTDSPIMLALYDPIAPEDPTGGVDGRTPDDELERITEELSDAGIPGALTVGTDRGYVWLDVVWDDGALQDAVDGAYGDDVVLVTSALREID